MAKASTAIIPIDNARCESPGCQVKDLVARVPKLKTPQFVVSPTVVQKPLILNGFNTVFQISGSSAKFSDVRNKTNGEEPSIIYRIVANTHSHIVNYVVVDDEEEAMNKITGGDPYIMTKLLSSQVGSAEKMLARLMYEQQGTLVHVCHNSHPANVKEVTASNITENLPLRPSTSNSVYNITNKTFATAKHNMTTLSINNNAKNPSAQGVRNAVYSKNNDSNSTSAIITPISKSSSVGQSVNTGISTTVAEYKRARSAVNINQKFHINPQIKVTKITPVLGTSISTTSTTSSSTATATTSTTAAASSTPIITTVPLAKLQNPTMSPNKSPQYPKLPVRTTIQLKTKLPTITTRNNPAQEINGKTPDQ